MRPYVPGRRRAPDRLEGDSAHRRAARARRDGRARAGHVARPRHLARRCSSAPPIGGRPTSRRVSPSRSATSRRGAATGSASSRSAAASPRARRRGRGASGWSACCSRSATSRAATAPGATSLGDALRAPARSPGSARSSSSSPTSAAPRDWRKPLLQLAGTTTSWRSRSAIRASRSCPTSGVLWLVDPETGKQVRVDTRSRGCASVSRPLRQQSAAGRPYALVGRASGTSCCHVGRLAPPARRRSSAGADAMTFDWPLGARRPAVVPFWLRCTSPRSPANRVRRALHDPGLLPNVVDSAPGWRRHLPPLSCSSRSRHGRRRGPSACQCSVPREEATIVLVIDISWSMRADDVKPTRLLPHGPRERSSRSAEEVPCRHRGFSGRAHVAVPPTDDRTLVPTALASLRPGEGTSLGDAVALATQLGQRERGSAERSATAIVVISDGTQRRRPVDPVELPSRPSDAACRCTRCSSGL